MNTVTIYYELMNNEFAYCSTNVRGVIDFHKNRLDFEMYVCELAAEGPVELFEVTRENHDQLMEQGVLNELHYM